MLLVQTSRSVMVWHRQSQEQPARCCPHVRSKVVGLGPPPPTLCTHKHHKHQPAHPHTPAPIPSIPSIPTLQRAQPSQVNPLRKQLKGLKAWITGQRKDQSPGTRMAVPVVQVDPAFQGLEGGPGSLIKYNPLSNVTSAEVGAGVWGAGAGEFAALGSAAGFKG